MWPCFNGGNGIVVIDQSAHVVFLWLLSNALILRHYANPAGWNFRERQVDFGRASITIM